MSGITDPFSANIINNDIRVNNSSDDQHSVHSQQSTGSMGGREISHVQALCNLYTPGNELFSSKTGVAAMMWTASVITVGIMPLIAFIVAALMDCCNSSKEPNTTHTEEFCADNNHNITTITLSDIIIPPTTSTSPVTVTQDI